MKTLLFCFSILLVCSFVAAQSCDISGGWTCEGGLIVTLDFSKDDDDVILSQPRATCTFFQEGDYRVIGSTVELSFARLLAIGESCDIVGNRNDCSCYEDPISFQISSGCNTLTGPNNEVCTRAIPTNECGVDRSCPGGQTRINDPDYVITTNGCGPQSIPFTAPSFSFFECCNEHDRCYADCSKTKKQCDDEFYSCTFCSCEESYSGSISTRFCQELSCLYYQAVDEFGCSSYRRSQGNACICSANKDAEREYLEIPSKFGTQEQFDELSKSTRIVCSRPFRERCGRSSSSHLVVSTVLSVVLLFVLF